MLTVTRMQGDFAKGIEVGCKRGRLLASRRAGTNRSRSLELTTSDGSGRGCLLITGKHYPSSPSRAFRSRSRPAMRRGSPSCSRRDAKIRSRRRWIGCSRRHHFFFLTPIAHFFLDREIIAVINCHNVRYRNNYWNNLKGDGWFEKGWLIRKYLKISDQQSFAFAFCSGMQCYYTGTFNFVCIHIFIFCHIGNYLINEEKYTKVICQRQSALCLAVINNYKRSVNWNALAVNQWLPRFILNSYAEPVLFLQ